jgi:predicted nucleotidyltransferase
VPIEARIVELLARHPEVRLAFLFGSMARGQATEQSDLDLAVAGEAPLPAETLHRLITDLAELSGRPVDLVDLQSSGGPILREAMVNGRRILRRDEGVYAELIKRLVFDQADLEPYRRRILAERRKAWIGD